MSAHKALDWAAEIDRGRDMDLDALAYSIKDALDTLPAADSLDRIDGGGRGGYYRDQISVYRAELARRGGDR